MRTFSGKRSALALAIAGVTAMSGWWLRQRQKQQVSSKIPPSRAVFITGSVSVTVKTSLKINTKPTFLTRHGTLTLISSRDMPPICSGSILQRSPQLKWPKMATAAIRTKLRSPPAIKPTTKTGPAIKAESACIKRLQNSNMVRSGRVEVISSQPARRC